MTITADKVAEVIILARDLCRRTPQFDSDVGNLTPEEKANRVVVMWIERQSFDASEWDKAFETAEAEATAPAQDYLKRLPHLSDHLENGLDASGMSASFEENDLY